MWQTAYADGKLHDREITVIQIWMQDKADIAKNAGLIEKGDGAKLTSIFKEAVYDARSGSILTINECEKFNSYGPTFEEKSDLINLCLDVMTADDETHQDEENQLSLIVNYLGFDLSDYDNLRVKKKLKAKKKTIKVNIIKESEIIFKKLIFILF